MRGDPEYSSALKVAKQFWDNFFAEHAEDDDKALQAAIDSAQLPFQWAVENVGLVSPFAKGIMALTCVGSLYNDGFEDRDLSERVVSAMVSSKSLSLGIGSSAKDVAKLYGLSESS